MHFSKNNAKFQQKRYKMLRSRNSDIKIILWTLFLNSIMTLASTHPSQQKSFKSIRFLETPSNARSLYEQYTLGQMEEGAKIIYTYSDTQSFDGQQKEISLDFHYPDETDIGESLTISQIQLYLKADEDASTQAFITEGGIGEDNISLQILATNSKLLNYMLVIYGKPE